MRKVRPTQAALVWAPERQTIGLPHKNTFGEVCMNLLEKTKIAVIGTGWWATNAHIPTLRANPHADMVLVDKNPQVLNAAATKYEIASAYTSLSDALNAHPDIQGAIVSVQHAAHHTVGMEVLEAGLHLLMEKPFTLYAKEARDLVQTAERKGVEIMLGYTFPYLDPVQRARQYVADGLIGEPEYITCSMTSMTIEFLRGRPQEYAETMKYPLHGPGSSTYSDPKVAGGGQGHLQITHSAAMMFYLAPSLRAEVVTAFMNNLDTRVDVADAIAVRMNNGAVATVGSTGNIGKGDGGIVEIHLHGSKGRVMVDAISGALHLRCHDGREERLAPSYPAYPGGVPSERFVKLIRGEARNEFPGRDNGLHTVELLDAAYRSAAQGGMPVRVSSLYD